jgi:hypothetical protein
MAKTTALKTKVTFIITTKDGNKEVRQLHIKGDYTYANILEATAMNLIAAIENACTN